MKTKKALIWIIAVIITIAAAYYQRISGPTQPVSYDFTLNDSTVKFRLPRSNQGVADFHIKLKMPEKVSGQVIYRRFPTNEVWDTLQLARSNDTLKVLLPAQPAAGKLEYSVELFADGQAIEFGQKENILIRFRDDVPAGIMIPHVLLIFLAMLWANATGILAAWNIPSYKKHAWITLIVFVVAGLIFGPLVQKAAFGAYWTGWPFGEDLTDNKVMLSVIFWILAVVLNRKKDRRWLVIVAALVMFIIFMIPHSARGSEFNYESGEVVTGMMMLVGVAGGEIDEVFWKVME
ncbi:hypothetical protein ACFLQX_02375 [Bacteroidota bacterium]